MSFRLVKSVVSDQATEKSEEKDVEATFSRGTEEYKTGVHNCGLKSELNENCSSAEVIISKIVRLENWSLRFVLLQFDILLSTPTQFDLCTHSALGGLINAAIVVSL